MVKTVISSGKFLKNKNILFMLKKFPNFGSIAKLVKEAITKGVNMISIEKNNIMATNRDFSIRAKKFM